MNNRQSHINTHTMKTKTIESKKPSPMKRKISLRGKKNNGIETLQDHVEKQLSQSQEVEVPQSQSLVPEDIVLSDSENEKKKKEVENEKKKNLKRKHKQDNPEEFSKKYCDGKEDDPAKKKKRTNQLESNPEVLDFTFKVESNIKDYKIFIGHNLWVQTGKLKVGGRDPFE